MSILNKSYDVVVLGGGTAGFAAALAAGRKGLKVLLVEKYGFLGGMATASLVGPWMTVHTASGKKIISGIVDEVVNRLKSYNASPGHIREIPYGHVYSITPFDPEYLKLVMLEMLEEANVSVLFHAIATSVTRTSDGNRIESVTIFSKDGFNEVKVGIFIDATGDGDISALAGVPFSVGRALDGYTQPMSHLFQIGGVELEEVKSYILAHPDQFVLGEDPSIGSFELEFIKKNEMNAVAGFFDIVRKAINEGRIPPNRDRLLFFVGQRKDQVRINMARVVKKFSTKTDDLNAAEIEGRKQIYKLVDFFREDIPGFKNCYLLNTPVTIGPRESRRIIGEYVLTGEDVIEGRRFNDCIGLGSYCIDIHDPVGSKITHINIKNGGSYDIPYRCLLPQKVDNLFVIGRPISVTHEAHASTRLQVICMVTGQAAGTACALALSDGVNIKQVDTKKLQRDLERQGVILVEPAAKDFI